jgi:hypothetical protein
VAIDHEDLALDVLSFRAVEVIRNDEAHRAIAEALDGRDVGGDLAIGSGSSRQQQE